MIATGPGESKRWSWTPAFRLPTPNISTRYIRASRPPRKGSRRVGGPPAATPVAGGGGRYRTRTPGTEARAAPDECNLAVAFHKNQYRFLFDFIIFPHGDGRAVTLAAARWREDPMATASPDRIRSALEQAGIQADAAARQRTGAGCFPFWRPRGTRRTLRMAVLGPPPCWRCSAGPRFPSMR